MTSLKNALGRNLDKLLRHPLYCFALILLALPVHLVTLLVYLKRLGLGGSPQNRRRRAEVLAAPAEAAALREEVERQLRNKAAFLGRPCQGGRFDREARGIYRKRLEEMTGAGLRRRYGEGADRTLSYVSVMRELLDKRLYLFFVMTAGLPGTLLLLIFANAYTKYILERALMMVFVIFGVTFLVFSILYFSPLDAATNILGPTATAGQIADFNKTYGLDQSFFIQLMHKFKNLLTFNLGKTYMGNEDVLQAILRKFPITLEVTFFSLLLAAAIALPAGIVSAVRPNTIPDYALMFLALLGLSIPNFWLGLMLINKFSIESPLLPAIYSPDNWKSLIMPAVVLGTGLSATVTRMTRSSLLEVINQDYITTARAKGLSVRRVIMGHALTNALIPIVTVVGLQFGSMLGGAAVTEKVFNINGIGKYIVDKQFVPDIPVVLAGVVYIAIVISLVNLIVDILYTFLDPRIKSKLKNY
jgi:peptide/nickel transport system permease protein